MKRATVCLAAVVGGGLPRDSRIEAQHASSLRRREPETGPGVENGLIAWVSGGRPRVVRPPFPGASPVESVSGPWF